MTIYAGFDASGFPGLPTMAWLRKNTNLVWCGFYLKSPSHKDAGWMPHRADLLSQGWGFAPIYVGQQVTGPGSRVVTAAQGTHDGADAAAVMHAAGFPKNAFVYLDLENGPPLSAAQAGYVSAWVNAVTVTGFSPGVYCSYLMAGKVHAAAPGARIWAFHVRSVAEHHVTGSIFATPSPILSGYPQAHIWQHEDSALINAAGKSLLVDLDTSISSDPSAPASETVSAETKTVPAAPGVTKEASPMTTDAHPVQSDSTVAAAVAAAPSVPPAAEALPSLPTAQAALKIDIGSWFTQLEEDIIPALKTYGTPAAEALISSLAGPMGGLAMMIVGPTVINDAIDTVGSIVESATAKIPDISVPNNAFTAPVVAFVQSTESATVKWLGGAFEGMVAALLKAKAAV